MLSGWQGPLVALSIVSLCHKQSTKQFCSYQAKKACIGFFTLLLSILLPHQPDVAGDEENKG